MQKVLVIASFAKSLIAFRGELIQTMLDRGIEVHCVAPELTGDVERSLLKIGCHCHSVTMSRAGIAPMADIALVIKLSVLMRARKFDSVLAYTIKPIVFGMLSARLARIPVRTALVTGLGFAFERAEGTKGRLARLVARALYRVGMNCATRVVFQNPDDRSLVTKSFGLNPGKVGLVNGSGVSLSAFEMKRIPVQPPTFLMIARLLLAKGVFEYAAAAEIIKKRHPDVRFLLAGWIDTSPGAIDLVDLERWKDRGALQFLGHLDDVRPTLESCSVYVLPSYREGTPRTVLEAMATGRPVVTTDAPGCRETVQDGDNGFLVPVRSVEALVTAMEKFIHDPTLAPRMGARSREIVEDKYDVHKVNQVMLTEMRLLEV